MLAGNTRDDGTVCGFGGCLYTRPASRTDAFTNIAPKLSATYAIGDSSTLYANIARGFRAPQATELYRLQNGQEVADLKSVRIDSFELGVRSRNERFAVDVAAYFMKKENSVLRDSEGFNVSNGSSRHRGLEAKFDWQWHPAWNLSSNISYGRHSYDFDLVAARGETFVSGRDIDTAPRWLGSIELKFEPDGPFSSALQWSAIGEYFLDAENRFTYPGHELVNIRVAYALAPTVRIIGRLNNVADEQVADRADYAFGNYRYFPGRGRELFIELRYSPPG
jgi:iron complex outermembrane receptor protein